MTNLRMTFRYAAVAVALLFSVAGLQAQGPYDLSWTFRPGDAAPVPPQLAAAGAPALNDNGQIAFIADGAVFFSSQGATNLVAGYGDPLPGGMTFLLSQGTVALNAQGQIAFLAFFSPGFRRGIFLSTDSGISKIAAEGDPAPGGGTFSFFNTPTINVSGQVSFVAFSSQTRRGLYLSSGGTLAQLARQGDPAPGGGTFVNFTSPSINSGGQVAFQATVSGGGSGGSGIFLASGGTITKIARNGDPAPGGGTFASLFGPLSLNDAGQIAFIGVFTPSGLSALYLYTGSQITELARAGGPAPGGGDFTSFNSPSLNGGGQVAFQGSLSTGNAGIFLSAEGSLTSIVRPGDSSPEGDAFSLAFGPSINAAGQVAFASRLNNSPGNIYLFSEGKITRMAGSGDAVARDPRFLLGFSDAINSAGTVISEGASFPGGYGVYDNNPNSIARTGDPAPGGGVFVSTFNASVNDNGDVVFLGALSTLGTGVFVSSGGTLNRLAATGDPAPTGGTFLSFFNLPSINNLVQVAFPADVTAPGRSGIFLSSEAGIAPLVQIGDAAPGGGTFSLLRFAWLNDAGQVAFLGNVTPPGRSGVFLWSGGAIRAVAQVGDSAPGGGTFTSFFGAFFGPAINSSGHVAFRADLSNGEGVFLFTDGTLSRIAHSGDPVPGGGTLLFIDDISLNDTGQVAFATVNSLDTHESVYLYSDGTLSKVARPGDPAPGGGTLTFAACPRLNAQGQVAMTAVATTVGQGVILATPKSESSGSGKNLISTASAPSRAW